MALIIYRDISDFNLPQAATRQIIHGVQTPVAVADVSAKTDEDDDVMNLAMGRGGGRLHNNSKNILKA